MDDRETENVLDTGRTSNRGLIRESPDRFSNKIPSGIKPTTQRDSSPSVGISHTESHILSPDGKAVAVP